MIKTNEDIFKESYDEGFYGKIIIKNHKKKWIPLEKLKKLLINDIKQQKINCNLNPELCKECKAYIEAIEWVLKQLKVKKQKRGK